MPCQSFADTFDDWNVTATTLTPAAGKNPLQESRIHAMVHDAIHDALNAIDRRYNPYAFDGSAQGASPEAAVAAAAYEVLVAEIPTQHAALGAAYAASLSAIADGSAKQYGVAVGQAAAAEILTLRSNDGSSFIFPYTPGSDPGDWAPTPPGFVPAILPGWGEVTPFTLNTGEQFLPDPPEFLDLASEEFTRDYNEVKDIGDVNSTTRSAEQSEIARFWYEGSPGGWNRITRIVSTQAGLGLWEKARLFALVNLAMADFVSFTTTSGAPFPGITRSFVSFSQAAQENADSRVYAGIHFRSACTHGLRVGEKIGKFAFKHSLKPVK